MPVVQPIVEGHGDEESVRILLRRLQNHACQYGFEIARPHRRPRPELVREDSLRRAVRLAIGTPNCVGILIVFDGDDDPACEIGPRVQQWAQGEAGSVACQVVVAMREYEAWFIAALESLRGQRGIRMDATSHQNPESVRGAKEFLQSFMGERAFYSYSPRIDQAALTAQVDLAQIHRRCRSFRKMAKAFAVLSDAAGTPLQNWPPPDW